MQSTYFRLYTDLHKSNRAFPPFLLLQLDLPSHLCPYLILSLPKFLREKLDLKIRLFQELRLGQRYLLFSPISLKSGRFQAFGC